MNYLAHCAIADVAARHNNHDPQTRAALIAGGFIGDFVKGAVPADWPLPLQTGVRLHRAVDAESNRNVLLKPSFERLPSSQRRFAPIFVDILADHCLALHWDSYMSMSIQQFSSQCYDAINEHSSLMSGAGQKMYSYMRDVDLLASYSDWYHVERGIRSVARRLQRPQLATAALSAAAENMTGLEQDFAAYYPQLCQHACSWLQKA